jgi:hypothetical protein
MIDGTRFKRETPLEVIAYVPAGMLVLYVLVRIFA